jgi:hypothetical protein
MATWIPSQHHIIRNAVLFFGSGLSTRSLIAFLAEQAGPTADIFWSGSGNRAKNWLACAKDGWAILPGIVQFRNVFAMLRPGAQTL